MDDLVRLQKKNIDYVYVKDNDFEKLLDLIDEIFDGWREQPLCRFSVLGANDFLALFP